MFLTENHVMKMGEWRFSYTMFLTSVIEVKCQLHAPVVSRQGKCPWYSFDRRLGGSQSQFGQRCKEKKSLPGMESQLSSPQLRH
jgi:hypothetical protein